MKFSEETKQLLEDIFLNYPRAAVYEAQIKDLACKLLELDGEEPTAESMAGVLDGLAYALRADEENPREHGSQLNVTFRKKPENAEELAAAREIIAAQFEADEIETDDSSRYFRAIPVGRRYVTGTVDRCGDLVIDFVDALLPDDLGLLEEE
jgi:hypothetical protein